MHLSVSVKNVLMTIKTLSVCYTELSRLLTCLMRLSKEYNYKKIVEIQQFGWFLTNLKWA